MEKNVLMWKSEFYTSLSNRNSEVTKIKNHIFFNGEVTQENCIAITNYIMKTKENERSKLVFHINSNGGSVMDGMNVYDLIQKYEIHTHGEGRVMSMALMWLLGGKNRSAEVNTIFMHHNVSYGFNGTLTQHERQIEEIKKLKEPFTNRILELGCFTKEELENYDSSILDKHIRYQEALERNIINAELEEEKDLHVKAIIEDEDEDSGKKVK